VVFSLVSLTAQIVDEPRSSRGLDIFNVVPWRAGYNDERVRRKTSRNTEAEIVKVLKTLVVALSVAMWLPMAAQSAEKSAQPGEKSATPAKCLEALVNPVTGYAVCVNPRGAPVDSPPPPSQPCKPRPHENETGTVYEHWSAC